MADIIINAGDENDGSDIEVPVTQAEAIEAAIAEAEAVEEVTAAAVAIAEIEANRDIIIAEIRAETETAAIEAVETESEDKWQTLQAQVASLSDQVQTLTAMLSTPLPLEEVPPSQTHPSASESPEVTPDSLAEEQAAEPPKRPKKSRWI